MSDERTPVILIALKPRRIGHFLTPIILALILVAGLHPALALSTVYNADKIVHAGAFMALGFFAAAGYSDNRPLPTLAVLCWLAIALEMLQGFIPGRYAALDDALIGCLAATLGCMAWYGLQYALGLGQKAGKT